MSIVSQLKALFNIDVSHDTFTDLTPSATVTIIAGDQVKVMKHRLSIDQNTQLDVSGWTSGSMLIMTVNNTSGISYTLSIPSGHYPENTGLTHPIPINTGTSWRVTCVYDGSKYVWNWTQLDSPV